MFATLTIRSVPGRPLADQWESLRAVAFSPAFVKWLQRNTEGVLWSDGVTMSPVEQSETWHVHRHYLFAVPRSKASTVEKILAERWMKAADRVGVDAAAHAQDVRELFDRADVWAVAEYISDQFALGHASKDGSLSPGELLTRAFLDDSYEDICAFVTIERAIPRQTIRASGVFASSHVAQLRQIERDAQA